MTRIYSFFEGLYSRRSERRNFIRALFAEVDFNTKDLYFFIESSRDLSKLHIALQNDAALIPHITAANHTHVYRRNITNLHYIEDGLIKRLVLFYGLLDKISAQINGLNLPSFATVSTAAKITTIERIVHNVTECEKIGNEILIEFKRNYRWLSATRGYRPYIVGKTREGF
ncbi:hypothetical protein [Paramylibacter ulvae]|nr:hypothetical protein [Amylibacter ulvae]